MICAKYVTCFAHKDLNLIEEDRIKKKEFYNNVRQNVTKCLHHRAVNKQREGTTFRG